HLDPDGRRTIDRPNCHSQHACGLDTGTENLVLMVGSLDAIDTAAGPVDATDSAAQLLAPIADTAGVPRHMPPRAAGPRWMARQDYDGESSCRQIVGERNAEKAAASGNDHPTGSSFRGHRLGLTLLC